MCPPGLFDRPAEAPRSAYHSREPAYSPRCLLSLQSRRRLGDRKPYRLVDPHVGISVSHRRDGYCRLHRLRGSCERSRRLLFATWPPEVAGPLAIEIHQVLTTSHGGLVTTSAVFAVYFSSSGI